MANDDQKKNLEGQLNSKAPWVVFYTSPTDTGGLLPLWAGTFNEKQRTDACDRYVDQFILEPIALLGTVQDAKKDCKTQMDALPADHPHRSNYQLMYQLMYDTLETQEAALKQGLRLHADLTTKLPQFTPELARAVVEGVYNAILRLEMPRVEEACPNGRTTLEREMAEELPHFASMIEKYPSDKKTIDDLKTSLETTAKGFDTALRSTNPTALDKALRYRFNESVLINNLHAPKKEDA